MNLDEEIARLEEEIAGYLAEYECASRRDRRDLKGLIRVQTYYLNTLKAERSNSIFTLFFLWLNANSIDEDGDDDADEVECEYEDDTEAKSHSQLGLKQVVSESEFQRRSPCAAEFQDSGLRKRLIGCK